MGSLLTCNYTEVIQWPHVGLRNWEYCLQQLLQYRTLSLYYIYLTSMQYKETACTDKVQHARHWNAVKLASVIVQEAPNSILSRVSTTCLHYCMSHYWNSTFILGPWKYTQFQSFLCGLFSTFLQRQVFQHCLKLVKHLNILKLLELELTPNLLWEAVTVEKEEKKM